MELIDGKQKALKFVLKDVISTMPDNVITHILDRLPIQDAVRTGILSTNWRFKWTLLTQLVFDENFFEYLNKKKCNGKIISRLLLHLKGPITKLDLHVDYRRFSILDDEDINIWVMFLSTKGIKDLTIINRNETVLTLHTHLFSCLELKHLVLTNCRFRQIPSFRGFTNLLSLNLDAVTFESHKCGEFLTGSPLLEILKISRLSLTGDIKRADIQTLGNLKLLSLPLCKLDNIAMMTRSNFFQLIGSFPKLRELTLDFDLCKLSAYTFGTSPSAALPCLKILKLYGINFRDDLMESCVFDLSCAFPNLQTLKIEGIGDYGVPYPSFWFPLVYGDITRKLQLQRVELGCIGGSKNEVCLIKTLLASSPFLKTMRIRARSSLVAEKMAFATKLLKLHRASAVSEIDLIWLA